MKKAINTITSIIIILVLTLSFAATASASNAQVAPVVHTDGDFRYTVSNGQATVVGYTGESITAIDMMRFERTLSIIVPPTLGGCPVTAIGDRAFHFDNLPIVWVLRWHQGDAFPTFTEETLPLGVVSIPNSVITIGDYAFANNPKLKSVPLCTANVTTIGNYAFTETPSLRMIVLRRNVTFIGENAFSPDTTTIFRVNENSVAHAYVIENEFTFTIRPLQQHD